MADQEKTINDRIGNPFGNSEPAPKSTPISRRLKDMATGFMGMFSGSKAEPKPSPSSDDTETVGKRIGYPGSK